MSLITKYRPKTFDEFLGNRSAKEAILKSIGNVHLYLLYGMRGCGKTTLARLIANELKVGIMDIHELNGSDNTGVDDARQIISNSRLSPVSGPVRVYIIDEFHRMTTNAQDCLLKVFEEPPKHLYFILCTTDIIKVLSTIRSRARSGEFLLNPLSRRDISDLLTFVSEEENIVVPPQVMRAIINASDCIPREALGILEKVSGLSEEDALDIAASGGVDDVNVKELIKVITSKKFFGSDCWPNVRHILKKIDEDPEKVRRAILGYLNKIALDSDNPYELFCIMEEFERDYFSSGKAGLALSIFRACMNFDEK